MTNNGKSTASQNQQISYNLNFLSITKYVVFKAKIKGKLSFEICKSRRPLFHSHKYQIENIYYFHYGNVCQGRRDAARAQGYSQNWTLLRKFPVATPFSFPESNGNALFRYIVEKVFKDFYKNVLKHLT